MSASERQAGLETDRPEERIAAIQDSMRCLVCGVLSLLPVLGIVFGLVAIGYGRAAMRVRRGLWNPGQRLLVAGLVLSAVGLFFGALGVIGILVGVWMSVTG